jgi:hypothetical protein
VLDASLKSGGRFCVGAFGKNVVLVAVKMFSHLIHRILKRIVISVVLSIPFEKLMLE